MAADLWNRTSIPRPGASCSVRVSCRAAADVNVNTLLVENETVLKLLRSEVLQTDVRVLYDVLYTLRNSFRANKTFSALKQVEQCVNRLKIMKLEAALQDLRDLCPRRTQRRLSLQTGEVDVPCQPMLEWLCLKVLGAAKLMSRTMTCCSKAFVLSKQHMKCEFVIMNLVITSMLSRLWVIFRGILANLSTLYQQLLQLHKVVAQAHPKPFLTDFCLPDDMAQFLGPFASHLLVKKPRHSSHPKAQQRAKKAVKANHAHTRRTKEDLGVAIERDLHLHADLKPFVLVSMKLRNAQKPDEKKQMFKKQAGEAATWTDMATCVKQMIMWCRSCHMEKEKRLLTFLHLKCQRMKHLEAAGYEMQRKLHALRQEVCWALSPQASVPKSCRSAAHLTTRFHALKRRLKLSAVRADRKKKRLKSGRRITQSSVSEGSDVTQWSRTVKESRPAHCDSHDDIDDIFASVGL